MKRIMKKIFVSISVMLLSIYNYVFAVDPLYGNFEPTIIEPSPIYKVEVYKVVFATIAAIIGLITIFNKKLNKKIRIVIGILALIVFLIYICNIIITLI